MDNKSRHERQQRAAAGIDNPLRSREVRARERKRGRKTCKKRESNLSHLPLLHSHFRPASDNRCEHSQVGSHSSTFLFFLCALSTLSDTIFPMDIQLCGIYVPFLFYYILRFKSSVSVDNQFLSVPQKKKNHEFQARELFIQRSKSPDSNE